MAGEDTMAGIEFETVAGHVAVLYNIYHFACENLLLIKKKRFLTESEDFITPGHLVAENALYDFLDRGKRFIKFKYDRSFQELGGVYAIGDRIARDGFRTIFSQITLLKTLKSAAAHDINVDYVTLLDISQRSQVMAVEELLKLYQRIIRPKPVGASWKFALIMAPTSISSSPIPIPQFRKRKADGKLYARRPTLPKHRINRDTTNSTALNIYGSWTLEQWLVYLRSKTTTARDIGTEKHSLPTAHPSTGSEFLAFRKKLSIPELRPTPVSSVELPIDEQDSTKEPLNSCDPSLFRAVSDVPASQQTFSEASPSEDYLEVQSLVEELQQPAFSEDIWDENKQPDAKYLDPEDLLQVQSPDRGSHQVESHYLFYGQYPYCEGYTLTRHPAEKGQKLTWARVIKTAIPIYNPRLIAQIQHKKANWASILKEYNQMGSLRKAQVDLLIRGKNEAEEDHWMKWKLAFISTTDVNRETVAMLLVVKRIIEPSPANVKSPARGNIVDLDKSKEKSENVANRYTKTESDHNQVEAQQPNPVVPTVKPAFTYDDQDYTTKISDVKKHVRRTLSTSSAMPMAVPENNRLKGKREVENAQTNGAKTVDNRIPTKYLIEEKPGEGASPWAFQEKPIPEYYGTDDSEARAEVLERPPKLPTKHPIPLALDDIYDKWDTLKIMNWSSTLPDITGSEKIRSTDCAIISKDPVIDEAPALHPAHISDRTDATVINDFLPASVIRSKQTKASRLRYLLLIGIPLCLIAYLCIVVYYPNANTVLTPDKPSHDKWHHTDWAFEGLRPTLTDGSAGIDSGVCYAKPATSCSAQIGFGPFNINRARNREESKLAMEGIKYQGYAAVMYGGMESADLISIRLFMVMTQQFPLQMPWDSQSTSIEPSIRQILYLVAICLSIAAYLSYHRDKSLVPELRIGPGAFQNGYRFFALGVFLAVRVFSALGFFLAIFALFTLNVAHYSTLERWESCIAMFCAWQFISWTWGDKYLLNKSSSIKQAENSGPNEHAVNEVDQLWSWLNDILVTLRLRYPPIKPGKKRLSWTCHCGYVSFDDFTELRPGGVIRYEKQLRKHFDSRQSKKGVSNFSWGSRGLLQLWLIVRGSKGTESSNQSSLPQFTTSSPTHNATSPNEPPSDNLYLLLCIPHRKYATKLIQPELREIQSDLAFFNLLKDHYRGLRGRFRTAFSLKILKMIKFVQFEMYKSELVDIRKQDDIPPENRKHEYRYSPIPAEIVPPIGENHMMHLFTHPEDADDVAAFCLDRIPKKVKDRLLVCPTKGTGLGWGIHFIEGWHYNVIWIVAFVVLLLASLVFLVCWTVLKQDIQGASGVAAYMLTFTTLFIGSIQAMFELN